MAPFFSVVIPTFNRSCKLKKTINSVLEQSFSNFEVLVMDDGSTDDTLAVMKSFNDKRLVYEWAPNSGGPATPRNRGINKAKGNWICFLDADDLWCKNKLKRVHEAISQNPDYDLICHNEILFNLQTNKKTILTYGPYEKEFYRRLLFCEVSLSPSATTVKREFILSNNLRFNESPDYVIVEDYDMWLKIAHCGGKFHFIPEVLGKYVIEKDNISSDLSRMFSNLRVLVYDHVHNVQEFESNKVKLWSDLNSIMMINRSVQEMKNGHLILTLKFLTCALKWSTKSTLKYIVKIICRKLNLKTQHFFV